MSKHREAPELAAAAIRMMRALARRAGDGELEALEALAMMQDVANVQLGAAVAGYREGPAQASWTTIGDALGMSRQAARQRWQGCTVAPAWPASSRSSEPGPCWPGRCNPISCKLCPRWVDAS